MLKGKTWFVGPCSIEGNEQAHRIAEHIQSVFESTDASVVFRGGAYKPRTKPDAFQGLGEKGLEILDSVREKTGMKICTELIDCTLIDVVASATDVVQVGSRNMHNYSLLKALGAIEKPVLLKRGYAATVDEWLGAAEYIVQGGNKDVILCERGIRTFTHHSRYTLDLQVIPELRERTNLPIVIDVSHAAGETGKVAPLAKAALAMNPDGIMLEVHDRPEEALSDAQQAISPEQLKEIYEFSRLIKWN